MRWRLEEDEVGSRDGFHNCVAKEDETSIPTRKEDRAPPPARLGVQGVVELRTSLHQLLMAKSKSFSHFEI